MLLPIEYLERLKALYVRDAVVNEMDINDTTNGTIGRIEKRTESG
jgi:hypothetical protein